MQRYTWRILHGYHQGLVLQEVLIVLYDVGVVEQLEDLALVLGREALVARHLLHGDLLEDDGRAVAASAAEVHDAMM